jgi:hypothetical protein
MMPGERRSCEREDDIAFVVMEKSPTTVRRITAET